ncbi:MAG: hypothetical protein EOM26_03600, partial [Alphaproteobacteria bacterium]|nr:hypothetical protein [Alphaproteobacteria bacterium]
MKSGIEFVNKNGLRAAFMKVAPPLGSAVLTAATVYGTKIGILAALGASGLSGGALVAGAAMAVGAGVTGVQYSIDCIQAFRKKEALPRGLRKYGLKAAFNILSGALGGAFALNALDEGRVVAVANNAKSMIATAFFGPQAHAADSFCGPFMEGYCGDSSVSKRPEFSSVPPPADIRSLPERSDNALTRSSRAIPAPEHPRQEVPNPPAPTIGTAPETAPASAPERAIPPKSDAHLPTPVPTSSSTSMAMLDRLDTDGWSRRAMQDLAAARNGAPWAI